MLPSQKGGQTRSDTPAEIDVSARVVVDDVLPVVSRKSSPVSATYDWVWHWKSKLPERKGQRCRILAKGALNSVLVEFEDGEKTVTSRYAIRRAVG